MIIGLDIIGSVPFDIDTVPIFSTYVEIKNTIVDELSLTEGVITTSKGEWGQTTILLARFLGDLEAGNIGMSENPITKLRIKRRNIDKAKFIILKELPFVPDPTEIIYDDYFASSDRSYEYFVTPVNEAGIEGVVNSVNSQPHFEGWWIVDMDNPENNFQFFYNLPDAQIQTEEDRTELSTFGKYPKVYYGGRRVRKGTLSGMFIPEGSSARQQYDKLDALVSQHKPLMLKNSQGRNFIVDISVPQETVVTRPVGFTKISVNWVEVDEYVD